MPTKACQLTLIGSGNSGHVPVYGCRCMACQRAQQNPAYRRAKTSAYIAHQGHILLLDANDSELMQRFPAGSIETILLTHFHMDHVQSLFDLRWGVGQAIPVLTPPDPSGCDDLYKHPGLLDFQALQALTPFNWRGINITPIPMNHSKLCFGYLFEYQGKRTAYFTDTVGLPAQSLNWLKGKPINQMLLDCSYPPVLDGSPKNHNDITTAAELAQLLAVSSVGLIHISHQLDAWAMQNPSAFSDTFFLCRDEQHFLL